MNKENHCQQSEMLITEGENMWCRFGLVQLKCRGIWWDCPRFISQKRWGNGNIHFWLLQINLQLNTSYNELWWEITACDSF